MRILGLDLPTSSSDKQQEAQGKPRADGTAQDSWICCSSVPLNKQPTPGSMEAQQSRRQAWLFGKL